MDEGSYIGRIRVSELLGKGITPCGYTYRTIMLRLRVCGRPIHHLGPHLPTPLPNEPRPGEPTDETLADELERSVLERAREEFGPLGPDPDGDLDLWNEAQEAGAEHRADLYLDERLAGL